MIHWFFDNISLVSCLLKFETLGVKGMKIKVNNALLVIIFFALLVMIATPVAGINNDDVNAPKLEERTATFGSNVSVSISDIKNADIIHHGPPPLPGEEQFVQQTFLSDSSNGLINNARDSDYEITLQNGWNMISVPKTLADGHNTGSAVFGSIDTGMRSIFEWDGATQLWFSVQADTIIRPLDGIWIYSVGTQTVQLEFKNDPRQRIPIKSIFAGWNAIGFSDLTPTTAENTLESIDDVWVEAIGFNAATQEYEVSIINGGSGDHSDQRLMYPAKGYWLYSNGPGTLVGLSA